MTRIKDAHDNWHHTAQSMTLLQTAGQDAPPMMEGAIYHLPAKIGQKMKNYGRF